MPWKIKPVDLSVEKMLLTGLIVNDQFAKKITPILRIEFLQSRWTRSVAKWCADYFNRYGIAPGNSIRQIYDERSRSGELDETGARMVGEFLERLSNEYQSGDTFNAQYIADICIPYLKERYIRGICGDVGVMLDAGDISGAENAMKSFMRIETPTTEGVDILRDKDSIIKAFSAEDNVLMEFPGALGELVGPLCRDDFFGIFGPAARGKSWWLMYMAIRMMISRIPVLYVSMEMTYNQMLRRLYQCFVGAPRSDKLLLNPVADCLCNQDNTCGMQARACRRGIREDIEWDVVNGKYGQFPHDYAPCNACRDSKEYRGAAWFVPEQRKGIRVSNALQKSGAMERMFPGRLFKLLCFPSRSISARDLRTHIQNFISYDGWVPGGIMVDYPDILGPIYGNEEKRHQINTTWEYLRGMSQEFHALVGVVSHTTAETFNRNIRQDDQSEDKRKGNHLTGAIALNQKDAEKQHGIMRISSLKKREEGFSLGSEVIVLQNIAIGRPYVDSFWSPRE